MALLVQKCGGSSLRDPEHIRAVADRIAGAVRRGDRVVVTVSAMGSETDELLALAPRVAAVRPGREMDMLVTSAEQKAAALVSLGLEASASATRSPPAACPSSAAPRASPPPRTSRSPAVEAHAGAIAVQDP